MVDFFQYSLESAICLAVLLLPYLLWFRKNTFHQWNRFYLLGALMFSLSTPLVNIGIATEIAPMPKLTKNLSLFEEVPQLKEQVPMEESLPSDEITVLTQPSTEEMSVVEKEAAWSLYEIVTVVYFLGLSVFAGMFLYRLSRLFLLIRRGAKTRHKAFTIAQLSGKQVFSFFHFVFVDAARYSEKELKTLIKHEKVHIQQWHSLDVLMLEILQVVFWFNPLYRIYRKLLQQEHEYFVDASTSKEIGQPEYAQMLLSLATTKQPVLGHAFAYIPIKHRIFKLFQKPSTTMEKSKFFIALPIVLSLFLMFSCSVEELNISSISEVTPYTGKRVSEIRTFFKDERSSTSQENEAITIHLNEDGTIADTEIKEYPIFTEDIPQFYWSQVYGLFEQNQKIDFLLKNVQWLVGEDADIKPICLKAILYSSNVTTLKDIEKYELTEMVTPNKGENKNNSEPITLRILENEIIGEDSVIKESSNGETKTWSKFERSAKREIQTNNAGKVDQIIETYKRDHTWHNKKIDSNKILAGGFGMHKNIVKLDVSYGDDGSIAKMRYDYIYKTQYEYSYGINDDGKHASEEKYTNTFRFTNDENGRVKTLEILDNEGTSLRKYRFHYNEAGYCIKKELIDQGGMVASSVRFEYEFYN